MKNHGSKLNKLEKHIAATVIDRAGMIAIRKQLLRQFERGSQKLGYPVDSESINQLIAELDSGQDTTLDLTLQEWWIVTRQRLGVVVSE